MYIYGSECTLTLIRNTTETPLPYTLETLREQNEEVPLDPLVGYMMPLEHVPTGETGIKVHGCAVTRICGASLRSLAALIASGYRTHFALHLNRIVERRIYRALSLTGWELRGDRGESVYLRLDMEGKEAADWDITTKDRPWEQNETLNFADGNITLDGIPSHNLYRFSLLRIYGDAITTILQLHYPLRADDSLNDARQFAAVTLTFGDRLRVTLTKAVLLTFHANTDNADEILVVRRFRIDGECTVEVRNDEGVWELPE